MIWQLLVAIVSVVAFLGCCLLFWLHKTAGDRALAAQSRIIHDLRGALEKTVRRHDFLHRHEGRCGDADCPYDVDEARNLVDGIHEQDNVI